MSAKIHTYRVVDGRDVDPPWPHSCYILMTPDGRDLPVPCESVEEARKDCKRYDQKERKAKA
jgi:hypothetical protein